MLSETSRYDSSVCYMHSSRLIARNPSLAVTGSTPVSLQACG
jgi:hypothetical protein